MKKSTSQRIGNSGAAYVLALVTLLVGMTLALAMIRSSISSFYAEDSRCKKREALNIAEAGVDYAYWQVHWKNQRLPYSADVSLSSGSFHVDATDDGSRQLCAMRIVCTATAGSHTYVLERDTLGLLPYHYCWCENVGVDDGDILLIPSSPRGIRSNGSIKLANASTSIPSGGWSNTTFSGAGVVSPQYTYAPKIKFPDIDYSYYRSIATAVAGSSSWWVSVTLDQGNFPSGGGVIFVYGDVSSMSNIVYDGVWIVIATGDITLNCPITAASASSYLVLLAGHKIEIYTSASGSSDDLAAVVYCPYDDTNIRGTQYGTIKDNNIKIRGSLSARNLTTSGDGGDLRTTVNWDTRLTPTVLRDVLRLPGT